MSEEASRWSVQAWAVHEWVNGKTQRQLSADLGYNGSSRLCTEIAAFCKHWSQRNTLDYIYGDDRRDVAKVAFNNYLLAGGILKLPDNARFFPFTGVYTKARMEHAFMLRCEGLTLERVGLKLGVCREQARSMINRFGWMLNRSLQRRRTKMKVSGRPSG